MPFGGRDTSETPLSSVEKLDIIKPFLGKQTKITAGLAAVTLASTWFGEVKPYALTALNAMTHNVDISEEEDIFDAAVDWAASFLEGRKVKKTTVRFDATPVVGGASVKPQHNARTIRFKYEGFHFSARVHEPAPGGTNVTYNGKPTPAYIQFKAHSKDGYSALVDKLFSLYEDLKTTTKAPRLFSPTSWGGFEGRSPVPPRSLKSVILKKDELADLLTDIENFLLSESRYSNLGLPWHRGYLFHGCAGTGKTSIAKALSAHFGLDVYVLSIGDIDGDNTLNGYMRYMKPRSVLLLEDIDVFSAATSREAEENNASLSGLLNVLDGIATPHGMITIMTTNHIERLDEALIRPGRIDVRQEFTELDQDQGERLFEHFYGYKPEFVDFKGRVPSSVVGIFTQNLDTPEKAIKELLA